MKSFYLVTRSPAEMLLGLLFLFFSAEPLWGQADPDDDARRKAAETLLEEAELFYMMGNAEKALKKTSVLSM